MDYILQITVYYFTWIGGILLAARGKCWASFFLIVGISILQIFWQLKIKKDTKGLFILIILLTVTGTIVDTLFLYFKLLHFSANPFNPYFSPPWMITIWFNFSILLFSLARNLFHRYCLMGLLSLIAFPLSYLAGAKLGAASFSLSEMHSIVIGIVWGFLLPFCLFLYNTCGIKYA